MECGLESSSIWCTGFGQILILAFVFVIVGIAIWQGYLAIKRYNQPRDMSKYSQFSGTFSSAVDETGSEKAESEQDSAGLNQNVDDEDEEEYEEDVDTSEEGFEIDLNDETEIFLKNTDLAEMTYGSLIKEYFKLDTGNFPAKIVDYSTERQVITFALNLVNFKIVYFLIPLGNIKFVANNSLTNLSMEILFTEDFLESSPDFDSDLTLKQNLMAIDWDEEVFDIYAYNEITIMISETEYEGIFSK